MVNLGGVLKDPEGSIQGSRSIWDQQYHTACVSSSMNTVPAYPKRRQQSAPVPMVKALIRVIWDAGLPDNISIPPPRPKRKPSHPYPKKPFSGPMSMATEGGGSQEMPPPRLPDYSHLAPKLSGSDRLDVAVAAVAQAASAAAAAAAAAVISAAGEQIRAHMQVC